MECKHFLKNIVAELPSDIEERQKKLDNNQKWPTASSKELKKKSYSCF